MSRDNSPSRVLYCGYRGRQHGGYLNWLNTAPRDLHLPFATNPVALPDLPAQHFADRRQRLRIEEKPQLLGWGGQIH